MPQLPYDPRLISDIGVNVIEQHGEKAIELLVWTQGTTGKGLLTEPPIIAWKDVVAWNITFDNPSMTKLERDMLRSELIRIGQVNETRLNTLRQRLRDYQIIQAHPANIQHLEDQIANLEGQNERNFEGAAAIIEGQYPCQMYVNGKAVLLVTKLYAQVIEKILKELVARGKDLRPTADKPTFSTGELTIEEGATDG